MKRKAGNRWPGFPERLCAAFKRAGYWKQERNRPDVLAFSLEHRFYGVYVYKWVGGTAMPDRDNLLRLADALEVEPAWLLFGDAVGSARPKGGPLPVETASGPAKATPHRSKKINKNGTLCKPPGKMAARPLRYVSKTTARGTRRRVA